MNKKVVIVVGKGGDLAHQVSKHHVRGNASKLRILKTKQKITAHAVAYTITHKVFHRQIITEAVNQPQKNVRSDTASLLSLFYLFICSNTVQHKTITETVT